jgi:hypothetical protein
MNSPITVRRAYPVALPSVAATVTTDAERRRHGRRERAGLSASTVTTLVAPPVSVAVFGCPRWRPA